MIGLLPTTRIFLATAPTDLRKAYDTLAALVRQSLGQNPLDGSLYVFCNRRRDRIKILFWEEGGYWLCARRLEEGTFRWPSMAGACVSYRREELLLLLVFFKGLGFFKGQVSKIKILHLEGVGC
jgi:transposase